MNNNTINLLALALLGLVNAGCVTHTHHRPYTTSYVETGYVTPGYGAATHTAPAVVETIYVEEPVYVGGHTTVITPPPPPPPAGYPMTAHHGHPRPIQSTPVARPPVHQKPNPPAVAPKPQPTKPAVTPKPQPAKPAVTPKPLPAKPAVTPKPQPTKPMVTAKPRPTRPTVNPNRTANAASAARSRPSNEHQSRRNGHGQGEHKRPARALGERRPRH